MKWNRCDRTTGGEIAGLRPLLADTRNGIPAQLSLISSSLMFAICSMDHIESFFIRVAYVLWTVCVHCSNNFFPLLFLSFLLLSLSFLFFVAFSFVFFLQTSYDVVVVISFFFKSPPISYHVLDFQSKMILKPLLSYTHSNFFQQNQLLNRHYIFLRFSTTSSSSTSLRTNTIHVYGFLYILHEKIN